MVAEGRPARRAQGVVAALALTTLAGCMGTSGASLEALRARSTFDLQCPSHELQLVNIDVRTKGIRGCGRQMTYVEICDNRPDGWHCTWVLNAPAWYVAPPRVPPRPEGSWWWTEPQGLPAAQALPAPAGGGARPWQPPTVPPQPMPPQTMPPRDDNRGF